MHADSKFDSLDDFAISTADLRLSTYDFSSPYRTAEANGSHKPYKDTAETQRHERRREADRKLDEDRQKIKEVSTSAGDSLTELQTLYIWHHKNRT